MVAAMKAKDKVTKDAVSFPDFRSEEGGNRRRLPTISVANWLTVLSQRAEIWR